MTAERPPLMRTKFFAGLCAAGLIMVILLLAAFSLLPSLIGWQRNLVISGSMRPGTDVGDVVLNVPRGDEEYGAGMVIVFFDSVGVRTVHRVVGREPDGRYITKGDANAEIDTDRMLPEQVVGHAAVLVPWLGLPFAWVQDQDWVRVGGAVVGMLVLIMLAPYGLSVDHDPWAAERVAEEPEEEVSA